ncbi:hypothetical protein [Natrinema versiforme]|uniref:Uncharacterized protein n=1 Tax=Natrinema versiforme TaxID=88724 RepID=A0A4P8WKM3_9EURY|nr:hypothetical protein [Natrinema versiforme]QCS43894.1 hypothetical protein FEJ81_16640 [Natrinema versiforme]
MREWQEDNDFVMEFLESKDTILEVQVDTEYFIYLIETGVTDADNIILSLEYDEKNCHVVFDGETGDVLQKMIDDAMDSTNSECLRIRDNTTDRVDMDLDLEDYTLVDDYL